MSDVDSQTIDNIRNSMHRSFASMKKRAFFSKQAFTPIAPPAGPQMAPQGGAPMPPQGGAPMPPGPEAGAPAPADPNAMPPGGAPPMPAGPDGAPPQGPDGAPPQGPEGGPQGAVPPELQQVLSDLAGGVEGMSQTMKEQQAAIDQLSKRQLESDKLMQELQQSLKGPQPFDAPAETPASPGAELQAPAETPVK